ncbi:MAG: hypothetical protein M1822_009722 [Bathelium mastoideum]|nr:MAG: hypothetical protein M1822_009722 [Bathelium mastoideum]
MGKLERHGDLWAGDQAALRGRWRSRDAANDAGGQAGPTRKPIRRIQARPLPHPPAPLPAPWDAANPIRAGDDDRDGTDWRAWRHWRQWTTWMDCVAGRSWPAVVHARPRFVVAQRPAHAQLPVASQPRRAAWWMGQHQWAREGGYGGQVAGR